MSSEQPTNNPGTFRPPSFDDNLGADVTSPGTMSLGVGQKVFTHFTLKRLLGQGAMGMVWLAHNGNLNREVALKFLPQVLAGDNIVLDELRRETLRCLDLSHHHITRVYGLELGESGTGAGGKLAAIHMEYVDGPTLRELMHKRVAEEGKPPIFEVREISAWVNQLCDALHYAHTKAKLAHRDLKPSNVMINSRGELKLADFGVARKIVDNLAQVTNLVVGTGTTAYMSPQQMNGGVPHPTDDVYSLGATIFELLTSKPPFFSGDMRHQVSQVKAPTMTERREQLGFTNAEPIPDVWEETVAACLSKNPEDRPQTCEDVAKMLRGEPLLPAAPVFDKKGPATQRPTTRPTTRPASRPADPEPEPEEPRKGFPLMPVAAGVVVLLAVVGGGIWWQAQKKGGTPVQTGSVTPAPEVKPPPEAPAAPQFGGLAVISEPPGAEVIFDGKKIIRTPTTLTNIQTGAHTLLFRLPNHEDEIKEVTLKDSGTLEVKVLLKRLTGQVSLESKPDKSEFVLKNAADGTEVAHGQTPFKTNLATGRYTVTLKRPDHADRVENLTVEQGGSATVNYEFPQGAMDLRSTPPGLAFEISKDGKKLMAGVTPTNFTDLPAGSYRVSIKRDGYQPFDDTVAVLKGILTPINWNSTDNVVRGGFSITTSPTNASAVIEGQAPRFTPALFASLTPGKYNVTFQLEGYEPEKREIEVKGGATNPVPAVALKRSTGTLQLASAPANLAYEIQPLNATGGEIKKGSTKAAPEALALPTGSYLVKVQRPGWPDFSKEIMVNRQQTANVTHEFEEGTLDITVKPTSAKLMVDGKPVTKFPIPLPPGPKEIVASYGTVPNLVTNVALAKGQNLVLPIEFPGTVEVTVEPSGAEIFVGGVSRGKASPTLELAGLTPGNVVIEARQEGYQPLKSNPVSVSAGDRKTTKLTLVKLVAKPPVPTPPLVEPKPPVPAPKPVEVAKVTTPAPAATGVPTAATKKWKNSLGMELVAVTGINGLICIHETRVQDYQEFPKVKDYGWEPLTKPTPQTGEHPAVNVTWQNAKEYCDWLTEKERKAGTIAAVQFYRLPTDAEWSAAVGLEAEKGANPAERSKAMPKDKAPWGAAKDGPPPKGAGNYGPGNGSDDFPGTAPVKSFPANENGIYDLGGNAAEWCEDRFSTLDGVYVLRGGSWKTEVLKNNRPSNLAMLSGYRFPGSIGLDDTGFRVVLDLGK